LGHTNEKRIYRNFVCRPDWVSLCTLLLENVMKGLLKLYYEQMRHIEFCPYCMEQRNNKHSCCQENHFIEFGDFDEATQLEFIIEEFS
jgi:hypothetical protein